MRSFLPRFGSFVLFVLPGFDRRRFAGGPRPLNHARGVQSYLRQQRALFKGLPAHAQQLAEELRRRAEALARQEGAPLPPLNSPAADKEAAALRLAQRHPGRQGRVAVLSCVESCATCRLRKGARGRVEPREGRTGSCGGGKRRR